jgi:hypothetical protein
LSSPNKAGAEQQIALRSLIGDVKHTIAELAAAEGPNGNCGRRATLRIPNSSISKRSFSFQKTIDLQGENAILRDQRRVRDQREKTSSF